MMAMSGAGGRKVGGGCQQAECTAAIRAGTAWFSGKGRHNELVLRSHMEGEMTMQPAAVGRGLAHTLKDDVYGMILGVMFIAVGLNLLKCSGMITGGIAGIALLLAHVSSLPIGVLFFLANLPFLVFSYFTMGRGFMLKTLVVNAHRHQRGKEPDAARCAGVCALPAHAAALPAALVHSERARHERHADELAQTRSLSGGLSGGPERRRGIVKK